MVNLESLKPWLEVETSYGLKHFIPLYRQEINIEDEISVDTETLDTLIEEFGNEDVSIEEILDYLTVLEL